MSLPIFPKVQNDFIPTKDFLSTCQEIVHLIDKFGKVFAPIKYDMQMNIDVMKKAYNSNKVLYTSLQDLILMAMKSGKNKLINAPLWLERDLKLILLFFKKIISLHKFGKLTEDLLNPLKNAYKESLENYHNWVAQQLFGLLSRMAPTRSQLFKILSNNNEENYDATIKNLIVFNKRLCPILMKLIKFQREFWVKSTIRNDYDL